MERISWDGLTPWPHRDCGSCTDGIFQPQAPACDEAARIQIRAGVDHTVVTPRRACQSTGMALGQSLCGGCSLFGQKEILDLVARRDIISASAKSGREDV